MKSKLQAGDALLIIDPQNDFMPGGALGVPYGDEILPVLNEWLAAAQEHDIPIVVSRDWHPANHISFKEQGGPWPAHCLQNTLGAKFHKDLRLPHDAIIVDKAFLPEKEAYSAFEGTIHGENKSLAEKLKELGIKKLWIAGLALDYCVHYSAVGAHQAGFKYHVILPACRSIAKETEQKTVNDLKKQHAVFETDADPYY